MKLNDGERGKGGVSKGPGSCLLALYEMSIGGAVRFALFRNVWEKQKNKKKFL